MPNAKNFAKVTVSTGYDADDTSIVLNSGHGDLLPIVPFYVTWWNSTDYSDPFDDPNKEIVLVTARSTDTLTVTRAQQDTSGSTKNTAGKTYMMLAGFTAADFNRLNRVLDTGGGTGCGIVTETVLKSYTMPGSTFIADGSIIRITARGTWANNANTKTVRIKCGGTTVSTATGGHTGGWWQQGEIRRVSGNSQKATFRNAFFNTNGNEASNKTEFTSPAETLSGDVVIQVTGQGTLANDCVLESWTVELLAAA